MHGTMETEQRVAAAAEARRAQREFHGLLVALLPKLRVQALALTRNRAAAEDLVQDAVANALAAQDSFTPGTNFAAWMHRILRNRFISTLRKQRETTDIDDAAEASVRDQHVASNEVTVSHDISSNTRKLT